MVLIWIWGHWRIILMVYVYGNFGNVMLFSCLGSVPRRHKSIILEVAFNSGLKFPLVGEFAERLGLPECNVYVSFKNRRATGEFARGTVIESVLYLFIVKGTVFFLVWGTLLLCMGINLLFEVSAYCKLKRGSYCKFLKKEIVVN